MSETENQVAVKENIYDAGRQRLESAGMDPGLALDLARTVINCPDPRGGGAKATLGEFAGDVRFSTYTDQMLTTIKSSLEDGKTAEEAVSQSLSFFAERDENGQLVRADDEAIALAKKKLI